MKDDYCVKPQRILAVLFSVFLVCSFSFGGFSEQVVGDPDGNKRIALEEARRIADEIEAEYGIEVLLLEECDEIGIGEPFSLSHEVHSGSPLQEMLGIDDTAEQVLVLQKALSRYPADMFAPFRDYGGNLRFLLTGMILEDASEYPLGITVCEDGWFNIYLSLSVLAQMTIHHELWHALEYRILMEYPDALDGWDRLNPEGFRYYESYYGFRDDLSVPAEWILPAENAWFVRDYGAVYPDEDRATVYELFFASGSFSPEGWEEYVNLQAKLNYLYGMLMKVFPEPDTE